MEALLSFYASTGTAIHATYGGFLVLASSVTRRWEDEARDKLWAKKNPRR